MSTHLDSSTERAQFMLKVRDAEERQRGRVLVMCEVCDAREYDALSNLRAAGWSITREWAFCPAHSEGE